MAGWWASFSRRVRSCSASSFQSGARATGARGMAVRPAVNSSRVEVLGSIVFRIEMVDEYLVAEWLGDRDNERTMCRATQLRRKRGDWLTSD